MEDNFNANGCSRGVFAVWTPAELSTSHFSMLKPDSSISCSYDQTFMTGSDRSSLQKMETCDSETRMENSDFFPREPVTKLFEGCRRGVFALDSWVLDGDEKADAEKRSTPSIASSNSTPKRVYHRMPTIRRGSLRRDTSAAEAWERRTCTRGVFAVRELWDPTAVVGEDDVVVGIARHDSRARLDLTPTFHDRGVKGSDPSGRF